RMTGHANPMRDIDLLAMSGHKIYAPSSPGVVITKKALFSDVEPDEVGGGMVDDVYTEDYLYTGNFPDREEAGTPNIVGAIALATSLYALQSIGMDKISDHETEIINYAIDRLKRIDDVVIYGHHDTEKYRRAGAISINIRDLHHSLTAAILNDYFNIAVRNACFCAHPYVREMISEDLGEQMEGLTNEELEALAELHRGMVRCSFGIYNTSEDIDILADALEEIVRNKHHYMSQYRKNHCGDYIHESFEFDSTTLFSTTDAVDNWLQH
ncbi:MAG: aminotransferase class V-fold PLP-dependent enzyme, partial [Gammaproteobacteria bacterium]|nr:aminotransferase class V-fold PLP-dependent enzyme [Gammaproteobacteria bacterium]